MFQGETYGLGFKSPDGCTLLFNNGKRIMSLVENDNKDITVSVK
jgi:hypothetical protein